LIFPQEAVKQNRSLPDSQFMKHNNTKWKKHSMSRW